MAAGRPPVLGDLAVLTYTAPNINGDFSCAFERRLVNGVSEWVVAAEFIDGNLVVDGSVFTNVGLSAGISVGDLQRIFEWDDAADTTPSLVEGEIFGGGYIGFANNPTAGSPNTGGLPAAMKNST